MHNQTAILFFYKGKKMKLLSFAIPCYNSKDYMEHCIESILPGGDDVEIIIVDDGSKDETAAIADRYAAEYPDIVKAVHQENGGHGEAVNTGLKMPQANISRSLTAMIGWIWNHTRRYWTS